MDADNNFTPHVQPVCDKIWFMSTLDFGYPWWLSYGHLAILGPALGALLIGRKLNWSKWLMIVLSVIALWAMTAFLGVRAFDVNGQAAMPTQNFLRSGVGRVLDIGAGTGRSSILVLAARPQTTLVALDLFGQSFDAHFGAGKSPQERLLSNLKIAGVDGRATIVTADMRKLPFEAASFDGAVSAYAVDHLPRDTVGQALSEAARVLKPGGEFLLMLVANDRYAKFAFGPMLTHGGTRSTAWWSGKIKDAGFQIVEEGTAPATMYFLMRRP